MDIIGKQHIDAARPNVWAALNDPAVLKACLPGCESVERVSPEEFKVGMKVAIGPLRARFQGKLLMVETREPEFCVMNFEGTGGTVGFGKGTAEVTLTESGGGTELAYNAKAQVGGNLAQIGSRLIDSFAKKMTDDFFTAFRRQLEPTPVVADAPAAAAEPVAASAPAAAATPAAAPAALAATPVVAMQASSTPMVPAWWLGVAALLGGLLVVVGARAL